MTSTTSSITSPLGTTERDSTCHVLQNTLVDLVQLHLTGKQAHWNVLGPSFRNVHLQLDELVAAARGFADEVAERMAALGVPPDGRTQTVGATAGMKDIDAGWRTDRDVIEFVVETLEDLIRRLRAGIDETDKTDRVSQDLLISITAKLEEAHWMWHAQLAPR